MTVRRFFYTGPQNGNIVHRCYGDTYVEGTKLACGRLTDVGWRWMNYIWSRKGEKHPRLCKQCDAADVET